MDTPLMSQLKAMDGEVSTYGRMREDRRKLIFMVGPRAQTSIESAPYDRAVLRRLSRMAGQPIFLNGLR
jgi:hypothetical protein